MGPMGVAIRDTISGGGDDLITTTTGNYSVLVDHDAVYMGANSYGYAPVTYQLRDPSVGNAIDWSASKYKQ